MRHIKRRKLQMGLAKAMYFVPIGYYLNRPHLMRQMMQSLSPSNAVTSIRFIERAP